MAMLNNQMVKIDSRCRPMHCREPAKDAAKVPSGKPSACDVRLPYIAMHFTKAYNSGIMFYNCAAGYLFQVLTSFTKT